MASKPQGRFLRVRPRFQSFCIHFIKNDELVEAAKLAGIRAVVSKEDGVLNLLKAIDAELPESNT
jgi:hypothetical protein